MDNNFELLVRALIVRDKKILVCQTNGRDYYFLPGGHIEFNETMREALHRELSEELGVKVIKENFIGGVENIFVQNDKQKHEISFLFHTAIDNYDIESKEGHITFYWLSYEEFIEKKVVPPAMKDAVITWVAERKPFFIQEHESR